jgi:hypothetical protein
MRYLLIGLLLALAGGTWAQSAAVVGAGVRCSQVAVEEKVGGLRVGIVGEAGKAYSVSVLAADGATTTTAELPSAGRPQWFTAAKLGLEPKEFTTMLVCKSEDGTTTESEVLIRTLEGTRKPRTLDAFVLAVGAGEGDFLAAKVVEQVGLIGTLNATQRANVLTRVRRAVRQWQGEAVTRARAAEDAARAAQRTAEDSAGALD